MIPLLTAFQFLTIFPAVIRRSFSADELGRAVGFFPVVGLVLGGIFYGLDTSVVISKIYIIKYNISMEDHIFLPRNNGRLYVQKFI